MISRCELMLRRCVSAVLFWHSPVKSFHAQYEARGHCGRWCCSVHAAGGVPVGINRALFDRTTAHHEVYENEHRLRPRLLRGVCHARCLKNVIYRNVRTGPSF